MKFKSGMNLMTEEGVERVIVTKNGKAFGIVTERDLERRYSRGTLLESLASYQLITAEPATTIEKAVEIMLKNKIRKLPIVDINEAVLCPLHYFIQYYHNTLDSKIK